MEEETDMSIVYDASKGKLFQNNFITSMTPRIDQRKIGGEMIILSAPSSDCINLLDPIYEIFGEDRKEFVEKLSSFTKLRIIKESDECICICCKRCLLPDSKMEEVHKQMVDFFNSFERSISIKQKW